MAKVYNTRVIAQNKVTVGDNNVTFKYRGFSSKEFKRNYKLFDFELVKQDLINHFYIRKGEKLENPEFGTIIWDVLFEQFTDTVREEIAKDVQRIINFDKRLRIESLEIDTAEHGIRLQATLVYLPDDLRDVLILDFDRRNGIIN
jgi:phage baseplate assembly protein W